MASKFNFGVVLKGSETQFIEEPGLIMYLYRMYFGDLGVKEIDEVLREEWQLSLFQFAQVLATCAGDWLQRPEMLNITKAKIKRQRKLLLSLKTYIFKRLKEIDSANLFHNKTLSDEELIKEYKLTAFFRQYFNPLMARLDVKEKAHRPSQGAHIAKRSVLAASWGSLILQHGQKMNWALLADLYEWFWEKLRTIPYYRSIKPPDDLVNYLSVQYHRYKNDSDSIYCVETYGPRDYLTIFAHKGSFVDRNFVYTDDILTSMPGVKKIPLSMPWEHGLTFEGNDLADYLRFSASLYLKRRIKNIHQYPLIVFPDKSWYCPNF